MRMPETQLRQLSHERYEYSELPRGDEPEWDQLVKFAARRVEKFLKSTGIEVKMNDEVTENGRYSPRFVDEIADEIDIIEDKKDSYFNRKQLKKLFIPMLIILKLFKLKLLLFLPLILGLASFKKLLGFLAIVIPGVIGFFKLCKPDLHSAFGHSDHYSGPHYSPAGIGYYPHVKESYPTYSRDYSSPHHYGHNGVAFEDYRKPAQELAYSGYSDYRNSKRNLDGDVEVETSSKKSILPDS
uniref:Osiris 2 n=1 Tax=Photinus pyralis TaxID=7054 RepID=A0A1Y1MR37_PHOPY